MSKHNLENLNQEFYQISPRILESFSKFRIPLNLYIFKEEIAALRPFYKKDTRLQKEEREQILELAKQGLLFVSRNDHPIYTKHISKQLDLILIDKNLTPAEITSILKQAIPEHIKSFYEQPVQAVWDVFKENILILLTYIQNDPHRIKSLLKNLFNEPRDIVKTTYNAGIFGLGILFHLKQELKDKDVALLTLGLFSYDLGLYRVPKFIREKTSNLTPDEEQKILNHPIKGAASMRKLDVREDILLNCHLEHHERANGTGYPQKLTETQMSFSGKLTSLAHFCAEQISQNVDPKQLLNLLSQNKALFADKFLKACLNLLANTYLK